MSVSCAVSAVAGVQEHIMVGKIVMSGVRPGICVPQHGHCPQHTCLGSWGERLERGIMQWKLG